MTTSGHRLITAEKHVVLIEEIHSLQGIYKKISDLSNRVKGTTEILEQLYEILPDLTGLDFMFLHYYDRFVAPSNFQGYALVVVQKVPPSHELISEIVRDVDDNILGTVLMIAASSAEDRSFRVLQEEANRIVDSRVKLLRNMSE